MSESGQYRNTRARSFVMPQGRVLSWQLSGIVRWSKAETLSTLVL